MCLVTFVPEISELSLTVILNCPLPGAEYVSLPFLTNPFKLILFTY